MEHTRAVAYIRVSTDKQASTGLSLDAQRAKVEAYARLYDLDLVDVIVDAGASAKTLERPGLTRALGMLERGQADALVVVKLDRLTRSVRDLGHLLDRYFAKGQWALMSVSENIDTRSAAGRLVLNVLASVAQWEREATGERTKVALALKKQRGEYTGGRPPYGWRLAADKSTLEPYPPEQEVIADASNAREQGMSLREVAPHLDRLGHRTRDGGFFSVSSVHRLIARAA